MRQPEYRKRPLDRTPKQRGSRQSRKSESYKLPGGLPLLQRPLENEPGPHNFQRASLMAEMERRRFARIPWDLLDFEALQIVASRSDVEQMALSSGSGIDHMKWLPLCGVTGLKMSGSDSSSRQPPAVNARIEQFPRPTANGNVPRCMGTPKSKREGASWKRTDHHPIPRIAPP